jgi:hypothetical protein
MRGSLNRSVEINKVAVQAKTKWHPGLHPVPPGFAVVPPCGEKADEKFRASFTEKADVTDRFPRHSDRGSPQAAQAG